MKRSGLESQKTCTENLFISYRRDDAAAYAGRICDHMTALLGGQRVFMDVEDIRPGQNFEQAIDKTMADCSTVLVVIGPRWQEILAARAGHAEQDYVVREIAAALQRKKTVVPVLVGGAPLTSLNALPSTLADLSLREAVELRDASFKDDCDRLAKALQLSRTTSSVLKKPLLWLLVAAVLGAFLFFAASTGLGPWHASYERKVRVTALEKTAASQQEQTDYEAAFQSYQEILSSDPNNRAALDGRVDAAMLWLQNFHVLTPEGKNAEDIAKPVLAKLKAVLESGLARTNGKDARAADILSHLGWEHWMNEKIAFQEFGNAKRFWTQALSVDPSNVYAHAFFGNWLLQTHGDSQEALAHFDKALAANRQHALARRMQLAGLYGSEAPEMRAAFVKALNQVRLNKEPLEDWMRVRLAYLFEANYSDTAQLRSVLTAVSPQDTWQTYLWLYPPKADAYSRAQSSFIHAYLTELGGDRTGGLAEFKAVAVQLDANHFVGRMVSYTKAAIERLR